MKYTTDIEISVKNGKEESEIVFENETVEISRAGELWIKALDEKSEFFETVKLWHELDINTGTTSYLKIRTSETTPVQPLMHKVKRISHDNRAIVFEII